MIFDNLEELLEYINRTGNTSETHYIVGKEVLKPEKSGGKVADEPEQMLTACAERIISQYDTCWHRDQHTRSMTEWLHAPPQAPDETVTYFKPSSEDPQVLDMVTDDTYAGIILAHLQNSYEKDI